MVTLITVFAALPYLTESSASSPNFTGSDKRIDCLAGIYQDSDDNRRHLGQLMTTIIGLIQMATYKHNHSLYSKKTYHTFALSSEDWVQGLLSGHPEHILCVGLHKHILWALLVNWWTLGSNHHAMYPSKNNWQISYIHALQGSQF